MDPLGRLLEERLGALTRTYRYDPNGNRIEQSDYAGHRTTLVYDDANHLVTRNEGADGSAVRTTQMTYDALGHVLTETIGEGDQMRRREYRYDDPAYRRTHVRRELVGEGWIEEVTQYDGNGNAIASTDVLNRTTSRVFDARDRLIQESAPLGKVTTLTYDGRDAVRTETRSNAGGSGAQVRERRYDDDGRVIAEIDANGTTRTLTYDAAGNVLARSDGLGHLIRYAYDARRNRTEERGPEAGQLTTYGYDANDNRIREQWANGRVLIHTYDDEDRPLDTTDSLGPVESRRYWPDGLLKSIADADGRTTYQFHDSLHRLVREELPGESARTRTFTHTIHGEVLTESDPRGLLTQYTIDSLGRRTSTTFPAVDGVNATVRTRYDAVGNAIEQTNARNQTTTSRYNDLNQKVEQVDPLECGDSPAGTARMELGKTKAASTAESARGSTNVAGTTAAQRDGMIVGWLRAAQRLVIALMTAVSSPVSAQGDVSTSPASLAGIRSAAVIAAATQASTTIAPTTATPASHALDASRATTGATVRTSAIRQTTAPASSFAAKTATSPTATCLQTWTYDTEGNVLTQVDRRGITTVNTYDHENRLRTQAKAGLVLQTLERDSEGNVRRQTDALGRVTAFTYDKANRKLSEDRAGLATEHWTYTPLGDVATHTDADGRTTTNTYTPRRFVASESLAGETTQYSYDGVGHRTTMQRPNRTDATWTYAYDAAGNLAAVTDPEAHATTFGYDAANNRTHVTDANDYVTTFGYDERNRLSGKTYPGGGAWTWRYDGDNNRIRSEAPNGRVTETAYDALNRPTLSTYVGAPAGEVQSTAFTYDGNGNVRTITETNSSGTRIETRDYDHFDRLVDAVDGDGRTLHYAYDDVGNRTRLTDPDGHDTVWAYNDLNQNTQVNVPGLGTTTLGYAPSGRLTAITRPDGSLTEHAYFDNGRLQTLRHSKAGQTLARYDYVYDPNGNRTEQRELNGAATGDTTQSTRYVYDDADRLVEVKEPNRTTTYTLDAVGNRTAETVVDGNNTVLSQSTLTYNDRDQLTNRSDPVANVQVIQTWDSNGNLATQAVNGQAPRVYTYDARDRLVGLTLPTSPTGPTTLAFAYHPDGLRREKTDGVTTTRYHYDGQSLLAETNTLGNTRRQFHYSATQLIAQTQAGATPTYRHVLLDALRSPVALLDPTGLVTARTSYDAFGEIRAQLGTGNSLITPNREAANAELPSTDNQPIGFTGYLKDTESGLYYAKARYYDPATARFTTEDPEAGKDLEPPSLHRYLYAYANPTAYVDPAGRAGFLTDMRDRLNQTDDILREWAAESDGTVGMVAASISRVVVNVGSVPTRLANLVSDGVAQALPGQAFEGVAQQGSIDFGQTVDATSHIVRHPIDTGAALHAAAVDTTSRTIEGDRGAASDMFSFGGELLSGSGIGKKIAQKMGRNVTNRSAATVVEGADSKPAFNPSGEKPLAQFFDDPEAGHALADRLKEGGDGRALSGHGQRDYPLQNLQVPEGTAVTQLRSNVLLSDDIALKIEAGNWDELARDFAAKPLYQGELSGMHTALPGSTIPDYTWLPPAYKQLDPLTIHKNSVTTGTPRRLSTTLQPNMGCINFVACTVFKDENFGD
ncbi:RHS repeat-associated core domain-containing protein [Tahibacter caeni]|uniref:RHS repeat-associated core domain-containing protein n=1 Tax=Tahibacter caeni TaxID=1453545 RepID=UPI0021487542|nr:RHS repeat-associated core domain-containing protein [Tahibacter caeni]